MTIIRFSRRAHLLCHFYRELEERFHARLQTTRDRHYNSML